jgi:serine/threonine-protein kinase RsbW
MSKTVASENSREERIRGRCLLFLEMDSALDQLAEARRLVEEVVAGAGLDDERIYNLKVAVSEACANAIEHSSSDSQVTLCVWLQDERLLIEIRHPGDFRLASNRANDIHRGLGLPLMVALMDEVKINRLPGGGTLVSLSLFLE